MVVCNDQLIVMMDWYCECCFIYRFEASIQLLSLNAKQRDPPTEL